MGSWLQPIRGTTHVWVVTRHKYRIFAFVCEASFRWRCKISAVSSGYSKKFKHPKQSIYNTCVQNLQSLQYDSQL